MRILHVSKYSQHTGGVESHIKVLMAAQEASGHEVDLVAADQQPNSEQWFCSEPQTSMEKVRTGAAALWSRSSRAFVEARVLAFRPDVVHYHSIYHQLSPSVLGAARIANAASIMTLHDYKLIAPCYVLFRDGAPCTDCLGKLAPYPSIRHRCVKGSLSGSTVCTIESLVHRRRYQSNIESFIVPSRWSLQRHSQAGVVPLHKLRHVAWGIPSVITGKVPSQSHKFVFVGRLAPEKGILELLTAWSTWELPPQCELHIYGGGPLESRIKGLASSERNVHVHGVVSPSVVAAAIADARCLVAPSRTEETFGLMVLEAMSVGRAVIASDIGALPELVIDKHTGFVVPMDDLSGWQDAIRLVAEDSRLCDRLGHEGQLRAQRTFSAKRMAAEIDDVYHSATLAKDVTTKIAGSQSA